MSRLFSGKSLLILLFAGINLAAVADVARAGFVYGNPIGSGKVSGETFNRNGLIDSLYKEGPNAVGVNSATLNGDGEGKATFSAFGAVAGNEGSNAVILSLSASIEGPGTGRFWTETVKASGGLGAVIEPPLSDKVIEHYFISAWGWSASGHVAEGDTVIFHVHTHFATGSAGLHNVRNYSASREFTAGDFSDGESFGSIYLFSNGGQFGFWSDGEELSADIDVTILRGQFATEKTYVNIDPQFGTMWTTLDPFSAPEPSTLALCAISGVVSLGYVMARRKSVDAR